MAKKVTIGQEVARMLTGKSNLTYAKIADRIKAKFPEAKTTPRSVASIATHLRANGTNLPDRRKHV